MLNRAAPPSDFLWSRGADQTLKLGHWTVASITEASPGVWRVEINPELAVRRFEFFHAEDTALAYVNAWANKWQDELRHRYGRLRSPHPG